MTATNHNLDFESDDESIEAPSCIESLVSSSEQIRYLAECIGDYYIRILLTYGYASEPAKPGAPSTISDLGKPKECGPKKASTSQINLDVLMRDEFVLEIMHSTLEILPFLSELSSFVERCLATVESTLKRSTYHLNKLGKKVSNGMSDVEEFNLLSEVKIHTVFVSLMDLMFSILSLDKTIRSHTNIKPNLHLFKSVCQLVIDAPPEQVVQEDQLRNLSKDDLRSLVEFVDTIQLTICNEKSDVFDQLLEHIQHLHLILALDKTRRGFENLDNCFGEFIMFYAGNCISPALDTSAVISSKSALSMSLNLINSNIVPTLYMSSVERKILGLACLIIFHSWLFNATDKRFTKTLMQMTVQHKVSGLIHLLGSNNCLAFHEFLQHHFAKSKLDSKALERLSCSVDQLLKLDINRELERLTMKVTPLLLQLQAQVVNKTSDGSSDIGSLKRSVGQFIRGTQLMDEINSSVKRFTSAHLRAGRPMTKANLIALLRLVPLLKSIQSNLDEHRSQLQTCLVKIETLVRFSWRKVIAAAQKRMVSLRYSERRLDTASIMTLTTLCSRVDYLATSYGRSMLSICLSMLSHLLSAEELSKLILLMDLFAPDLEQRIRLNSSCGHLYWSMSTFSAYYSEAFEANPCALGEIGYFHLALDDIQFEFLNPSEPRWSRLSLDWLYEKRSEFLKSLASELVEQFQNDFLDRICNELEIELRLQTHRDLHSDGHNPFRRHLYNFKEIFSSSRAARFTILGQTISLRSYVEQYLNKVCYNLTAIAPHDWFTYDSMMNLARHKYKLNLVNSQLPTQTLDNGLDLLDITRNLPLFVSRYGYDLTNQLFIEKCSNRLSTSSSSASVFGGGSMLSSCASVSSNQLLNVLQVRHISRSIQTHGYGLLNSTVNCTYQTMKRLISLLSRQMSDDKLRVALSKEYQQISSSATNRNEGASISFDKAQRMAKKFRPATSVGPDDRHNIDLDTLRQTITQLGNLLALVRTVRSGALNSASKSVDYVPNSDTLATLRLGSYVEAEFTGYQLVGQLRGAAQNFDRCLADFEENFSQKTNYFSIIVDLFSKILDSSLNGQQPAETTDPETEGGARPASKRLEHMKLFFLLVPASTTNYIDHIINCKERVSSRSAVARFGALVSDDGFPMGVAFLLTILGQTQEFAKLEWFDEVKRKLGEDRRELEQRMADSRYRESLRLTSGVTLKRLSRLHDEYTTLQYTLNGALLFFRSSTL